jgi:Ca-activated chloride channel homolog
MEFTMKRSVLPLTLLLSACSYSSLGVTPGGSQDMNLARTIIENGQIPTGDSFTAEGLFSEHDLPLNGVECNQTLCPRTALALTNDLNDQQQLLVQLGFATNVTEANFQRHPLNISAAVDVSGSMSGDKLSMVKDALNLMVDQLNEDDQMSLVAYGRRATVKKQTLTMNNIGKTRMKRSIDNLRTNGSTNMEAGMLLSYDLVKEEIEDTNIEHRVMLFTDAQPNVGITEPGSFLDITRENADLGIGLSVFGVGLDLGAELSNVISKTRGGNSFFLDKTEDIETLFNEEFDFIVSPIAYDLEVSLNLDSQTSFVESYGAPTDQDNGSMDFGASTLFLSKRDGGIGALLDAEDINEKLGSMDIQYRTIEGELKEERAYLQYTGGELISSTIDSDDLGVFKMAHLINEFDALKAGSDFCEGLIEQEDAIVLVEAAQERLTEASNMLDDEGIIAEADLMTGLKINIEAGIENCWIADPYLYY